MFLKIETDEGISGWGEPVVEGRARTVETAVREFGETPIGKDPRRINDLWQSMYRGHFYRGGAILMSAIAGIDQALWDIKGKALGVPVYELLGGRVRKPGLGVDVDEERVIHASRNAPDWHNPEWRHAVGSVAEW
jgi:galactonate dehydratase